MCPVVLELKKRDGIEVKVAVTGQRRQMLDQVLTAFGVVPDYDLKVMRDRQTLFDITTSVLNGMKGGARRYASFSYACSWRYYDDICSSTCCVLYADTCRSCRGRT